MGKTLGFQTIPEDVRDLLLDDAVLDVNMVKLGEEFEVGAGTRDLAVKRTLLGPHKLFLFLSPYTFYLITNA